MPSHLVSSADLKNVRSSSWSLDVASRDFTQVNLLGTSTNRDRNRSRRSRRGLSKRLWNQLVSFGQVGRPGR